MIESEIPRLSRLTSIVTLLQSKRLITSTEIAEKFQISVRTAYRDIQALQQAGIPIFVQEGKGYSLVEGYSLPPVMFTEEEANALVTAEKIIVQNKDKSLVEAYSSAILKIKATLRSKNRDKTDLLSSRIQVRSNPALQRTSSHMTSIQLAITNTKRCTIEYLKEGDKEHSKRVIDPFALYSTNENWILIAYCHLRKEYRSFRLDRITQLTVENELFEPPTMTLQEYFDICQKKE